MAFYPEKYGISEEKNCRQIIGRRNNFKSEGGGNGDSAIDKSCVQDKFEL
jgi:hypothetical protein